MTKVTKVYYIIKVGKEQICKTTDLSVFLQIAKSFEIEKEQKEQKPDITGPKPAMVPKPTTTTTYINPDSKPLAGPPPKEDPAIAANSLLSDDIDQW